MKRAFARNKNVKLNKVLLYGHSDVETDILYLFDSLWNINLY